MKKKISAGHKTVSTLLTAVMVYMVAHKECWAGEQTSVPTVQEIRVQPFQGATNQGAKHEINIHDIAAHPGIFDAADAIAYLRNAGAVSFVPGTAGDGNGYIVMKNGDMYPATMLRDIRLSGATVIPSSQIGSIDLGSGIGGIDSVSTINGVYRVASLNSQQIWIGPDGTVYQPALTKPCPSPPEEGCCAMAAVAVIIIICGIVFVVYIYRCAKKLLNPPQPAPPKNPDNQIVGPKSNLQSNNPQVNGSGSFLQLPDPSGYAQTFTASFADISSNNWHDWNGNLFQEYYEGSISTNLGYKIINPPYASNTMSFQTTTNIADPASWATTTWSYRCWMSTNGLGTPVSVVTVVSDASGKAFSTNWASYTTNSIGTNSSMAFPTQGTVPMTGESQRFWAIRSQSP